jgi:hypothetical protein
MRDFLEELKRRRVVRVGLVYLAAAFIVLQAADILVPALHLPAWTMTLLAVILALGLLLALLLAWAVDVTPDGIEVTPPRGAADPPRALQLSRRVVLGAAVLVLVSVLGGAALLVAGGERAADARDLQPGELDASAVVVLPFRVSADPSLSYLGEGMVDLLAAKLTGEAGPRAVDSRAVLRLWERATGGGATPIDRKGALDLARSMAAGQLLLGEIVGSPGRLTLSAAIHDVGQGSAGQPVTVTGAADSLPWLVDRLVAGLLSAGAGADNSRLALLTSASLPALRAYLDGKQAYRGGRFAEAAAHFRRAVEIDSTFALAGFELILAGTWTDGTPVELGRSIAWQGRDRLTARDRRRLELGTMADHHEQIRGLEALVEEQPDNAETWLELGELLLHRGPDVGMADAFDRALQAFERSVAVDSIYAPALFHAIEIHARRGDTAQVRRLAQIYFHRNAPESGYHSYIGWRTALALHDEALLREMRSSRFAQMLDYELPYITRLGQTDALPLEDVELVFAVLAERVATGTERVAAAVERYHYLLNAARPAAAERVRAAARQHADPRQFDIIAVRAATFHGGDATAAAAAALRLARGLDEEDLADLAAASGRLQGICAVEERRLAAGDVSGTPATLAALERLTAAARSLVDEIARRPWSMNTLEVQARRCAAYLNAWRSSIIHGAAPPEVATRLATLESILSTAPVSAPDMDVGNLVAARLHAARGDHEAALRAARRRSYYGMPWLLAPLLREEARHAEAVGDVAGAMQAWSHYLHLRAAPEPALLDEVGHAQARLEALAAGGGRRQ